MDQRRARSTRRVHLHPRRTPFDDHVAALVRQLSQSVIELPVHDQGLPLATATDRQLIEWRHELEVILRSSPLAFDQTDELAAVEAAIQEARKAMQWLGNTETRAQLSDLEARRDELANHHSLEKHGSRTTPDDFIATQQ